MNNMIASRTFNNLNKLSITMYTYIPLPVFLYRVSPSIL